MCAADEAVRVPADPDAFEAERTVGASSSYFSFDACFVCDWISLLVLKERPVPGDRNSAALRPPAALWFEDPPC